MRRLQRHRGRRELLAEYQRGAEAEAARLSSSTPEVTSSRRPERGLPLASTSASQLCRCRRRRRRKRRRRNRLTSPPDHAGAARPTVRRERPLSGARPARLASRAPRARGGATAARRPRGCGQAPDSRNSDSDPRPPVATVAARVLSAFLSRALASSAPARTGGANPLGSATGWGPREARSHDEGCPHPASRLVPRCRCPPGAPRVSFIPPRPSRVLSPPGKPCVLFLPLPAPPWPPFPLVCSAFPERHVGGPCFVCNLPGSAALLLGLGLL